MKRYYDKVVSWFKKSVRENIPSEESIHKKAQTLSDGIKHIVDKVAPPEPLWKRKFERITEAPSIEPRKRVTYRLVSIFDDTTWLRQLNFNRYLVHLQFKMTDEGVKRYIDGKEVEQGFFGQDD
jgi:hypothetical protein